MAYESKAIANYLLDLAEQAGKKLNPMKIQKIVYFAHGWTLAISHHPLIDEAVEAWPYGPVIPTLYHEFKKYGSGVITGKATSISFIDPDTLTFQIATPSIDNYPDEDANEKAKEVLNIVWEVYGELTAIQLSNLTHEPDSPWSQIYAKNKGRKGVDIPDAVIEDYFVQQSRRPSA
jgi:uncharacterized phage-associated protein